jgi:hypothetical protein
MTSLAKFELLAAERSGLGGSGPHDVKIHTGRSVCKKKAASGGELPEAALAAVRSRDARQRGSRESLTQPKPYSTKALLNQATDD